MTARSFARIFVCLAVLVAFQGATALVNAGDTDPKAFYGRFKGIGFTQNPSLSYFDFDQRDLDVQIGAVQGGFFVEWTTVIRTLDNAVSKRKTARVVFEPSNRPNLFVERGVSPHLSDGMSWASIAGSTLTVRLLTILEDGSYEIQSYDRTLTKTGLLLFFKSDRDGAVTRVVTATLEKQPE